MTDLTTMTPVEIDELWAPLSAETTRLLVAILDNDARLMKLNDSVVQGGWHAEIDAEQIKLIDEARPKLEQKWKEARAAEDPFKAEWARRKGWTRAYLVITSGQGHVHRSMGCSTCFPTTWFNWMTQLSGASEQEIVDQAGERACTVCYKSAPVELRLDRPTSLFSQDEIARKAAREEREAKRAKAAAEAITVKGYYNHSSHPRTHVFKTVRAATNAIAGNLSSLTWYGESHPSSKQWISDIAAVRAALVAKGVEYDYDKALASARKRTERESTQGAKY